MHHGDHSERSKILDELFNPPDVLGATGRYPNGKLNGDDEGEIRVGIAADPAKRVVVVDFGKPTTWIGFTPEQAVEIAKLLTDKAWECRGIEPA